MKRERIYRIKNESDKIGRDNPDGSKAAEGACRDTGRFT